MREREREKEFQERVSLLDTKHLFELLVQAVVLYNTADISPMYLNSLP